MYYLRVTQRGNRSDNQKRKLRSLCSRLEFLQPFTDHFVIGHQSPHDRGQCGIQLGVFGSLIGFSYRGDLHRINQQSEFLNMKCQLQGSNFFDIGFRQLVTTFTRSS
jgi:hypothetical protein